MNDTPESGELDPVGTDEATGAADEDRTYDNLEDAMGALRDDDDEETEADEQPEQPEDEPEEGEAEEEADSDAEDADEPESDEDEVADGDAEISLPDGSTITVAELEGWRAGAMRQADYTQKTTELARQREAVEKVQQNYQQRLQFAETALQNLTENLQGLIPPEPDYTLAQTDPGAFVQQQKLRNDAVAELQKWLRAKREVDEHKGQASQEDQSRYQRDEQDKLVKAMPHLSDPARRDAFEKSVAETAKEFGFSDEDVANTHDHRVKRLVHYARLGMKAEHNRNNAKRRVETPKKAKATPAKTKPDQKNREAMRRLSKTGSIEDALAIDFD